jgi:hypothetical protein
MGLILRSSTVPNDNDGIKVKNSPLLPSEEDGNLMYLLSNMVGERIFLTGHTYVYGDITLKGNLIGSGILNATSSYAYNALTSSYILSKNIQGPNGIDSVASASYAGYALRAKYADKVDLKTTNGKIIESNVRSINGQTADKDGNIAISLLSTKIGTLDEMNVTSGDEGTIWITTSGDTYLFKSNKWIKLPSYNQSATDQRYLKLTGGILAGPLDMDSYDIMDVGTIASEDMLSNTIIVNDTVTAKEFIGNLTGTADKAKLSSNIEGGSSNYISLWKDETTLTNSNVFQDNKGNIGIETTNPQFKLDVNGTGKFNNIVVGNTEIIESNGLIIKGKIVPTELNTTGPISITGLKDATKYNNIFSISGLGGRIIGVDADTMTTTLSIKLNNSSAYTSWDFVAGGGGENIIKQNNTLAIYKTNNNNIPIMAVGDTDSNKLEVKNTSVTINTILELPPIDINNLPESPLIGSIATVGNGNKFGVYVYNGKVWKQLAFI